MSREKIDAVIKRANEEANGSHLGALLRDEVGLNEADVNEIVSLVQCEKGADLLVFLKGHADLSEEEAIGAMMLMQQGASGDVVKPLIAMGAKLGGEQLAFVAQTAEMVCTIDEETGDLSVERRELYLSHSPDWDGPCPTIFGTTRFQVPRNGPATASASWEFLKNQIEVEARPSFSIKIPKFENKILQVFRRSVPKEVGVGPVQRSLFDKIARANSMQEVETLLEKSVGRSEQMDCIVTDREESREQLYQKIASRLGRISFLTEREERNLENSAAVFDYLTREVGLTEGQADRVLAQLPEQASNQMQSYLEGQLRGMHIPIECVPAPEGLEVFCNFVGKDGYIEHRQRFFLQDLMGRVVAEISASTYISIAAEGETTAFWSWRVKSVSGRSESVMQVGEELLQLFARVQSVEECVNTAAENRGERFREDLDERAENIYNGFRSRMATAFINRERRAPTLEEAETLTQQAIFAQVERDLLNNPIRFTIRAEDGSEREEIFDRTRNAKDLWIFLQANVGLSEELALRAMAVMQQGTLVDSLLPVALIGAPIGLGMSGSAGWSTHCTIEGGRLSIRHETVAQLRPPEPKEELFPAFLVGTEYGFTEGRPSTSTVTWEILGNQKVL